MIATIKDVPPPPPAFTPVELTLTFENAMELNTLYCMLNYTRTLDAMGAAGGDIKSIDKIRDQMSRRVTSYGNLFAHYVENVKKIK